MLEKRTKLFIVVSLIFALLTVLTFMRSDGVRVSSGDPNLYKSPIRGVNITLDSNQLEQLFEQLGKFADKHNLRIRISRTKPSGDNFLVVMRSKDIEVVGVADSVKPGIFEIDFYNGDEDHPTPLSVFDELVVDLRKVVEDIPNTTITIRDY